MANTQEDFVDTDTPPIDTVEQEKIKAAIAQESDKQEKGKAELVLKSVSRIPNTNDYIDNLVMFKRDDKSLYGFLRMPGETEPKTHVMGFINQRKPDPETGEIKPSFILLRTPETHGEKTKWKDIGFINPVNARKDGKDVYFDQLLVNIQHNEQTITYNARTAKNLDPEMHEALGFIKPAIPRPSKDAEKNEAKPALDASKTETPASEVPAQKKSPRPRAK